LAATSICGVRTTNQYGEPELPTIEKRPLPAPNALTIDESDRSRLYDAIGRGLGDVLTGPQAYFPDGTQKNPQDIMSNLMGLVASVQNLQENHIIDPSNVMGPMMEALKKHAKDLKDYLIESEPTDPIEVPPEKSPTTRDNGVIYVNPFPGPESPPNPVRRRPQYYTASAQSPDNVGNEPGNSSLDAYPRLSTPLSANNIYGNQPETPMQAGPPLGIYSGKPMRQWIVPPPIWGQR
jgi:hypothetical protein